MDEIKEHFSLRKEQDSYKWFYNPSTSLSQVLTFYKIFLAAKILVSNKILLRAWIKRNKPDIALIERLIRDDLSPIEEAQAYMKQWRLMGNKNHINLSEYEIAGKLSKELPKSYQSIYNKLSLLNLPETIQNNFHFRGS